VTDEISKTILHQDAESSKQDYWIVA
jgi:hypothetical protein